MSGNATDVAAARHARIVELARAGGTVSVEALAQALDVTPQTIRKDLTLLERRSLLARVHGGAVATSGTANLAYAERRDLAVAAKQEIGAAAADLVPDGASLFINIGTTAEAIARHLVERRRLMVITNNLNVVDILAERPGIEVIAAGGRVRPDDRAVVGSIAMDFIRGFKVDFALIGASAIEPDGDFLDFDVDEVHVSRTIIRNARNVILAMDSSKAERAAPVRIGSLADIDWLVTDRASSRLQEACRFSQVELIVTRKIAS
ncbi:DeoR/GlpR family DNA-binding transcription regulator [Sphingomonas rubra]|uniref:Transcriptional regulator, DeoR family n=1 Tax=Sphingomonas rubra TaxID=634430 RepID=A0A1I5RP82_9SPHN|nr:DeoR/GlpR family DNA-binding transcription regulator [Sphingomonas rubra]SFP60364.1 transcriptional regulator, DeoR family [Sphingomonas rubra]